MPEEFSMKDARRSFLLTPPAQPLPAGQAFLRQARFRLQEDYRVKLTEALNSLSETQLWWRPNEVSNSVGNLVLHLAGNIRQWIIAGVGGQSDVRDRASEFIVGAQQNKAELLALLHATLAEVDAELSRLETVLQAAGNDAPLQRICLPQGYEQTVLDAVFHVVEHFSYHTGQIILLAKWLSNDGLRFYDEQQLNA